MTVKECGHTAFNITKAFKSVLETKSSQSNLFLQEELETEESSFREEEDTDDDMDHVEEEQEERSEKKQSRTQSRALLTPTQSVRKTCLSKIFSYEGSQRKLNYFI